MMNAITIRNLSDEVTKALAARAMKNGRTAEDEVVEILQDLLAPKAPLPLLTGKDLIEALQTLSKEAGGFDDIDFSRDQTPARSATFE